MIDTPEARVAPAPARRRADAHWSTEVAMLLGAIALLALFAGVALGLAVRLFKMTSGI